MRYFGFNRFGFKGVFMSNHDGISFWIRLFGCGVNVRNTSKLFSERNGFMNSWPIGRGYRISILGVDHVWRPTSVDRRLAR